MKTEKIDKKIQPYKDRLISFLFMNRYRKYKNHMKVLYILNKIHLKISAMQCS